MDSPKLDNYNKALIKLTEASYYYVEVDKSVKIFLDKSIDDKIQLMLSRAGVVGKMVVNREVIIVWTF